MEDGFISIVVMFLMLPAWMSAILFAIFVSIYIFLCVNYFPTLFLTLIFSMRSSNYMAGEEICLFCSTSFEEKMLVVSFSALVLDPARRKRGSLARARARGAGSPLL